MVGGCTQGQRPDGRTDTVEQQVAPWWVAGQADGHGHHRAQAVDEAETQHPDVRVAADMLQGPIAHGLPARLAGEDRAAVTTAHEVPELVTGIAAEERNDHHQADVHVPAKRKKSRKHQDGLAFEKGAKKKGKVAEILQELLKHFLRCWRNERAAYPFARFRESVQMCLDVNYSYADNAFGHKSRGCLKV
ncbi:hypothetical protein KU43P_01630 [Pseudomonas sp. KU43P]|nr:hypothetical protein KU43P_01630 [Pseudomonas sp. KU43P]